MYAFTHQKAVHFGHKGGVTTAKKTKKARDARWENIDFMLAHGQTPDAIAMRLGVSKASLARQAYRQGWYERARVFNGKD